MRGQLHPYRPLYASAAIASAGLSGAVLDIGHLPPVISSAEVFWIACELLLGSTAAAFALSYAWQAARWEATRRMRRPRPDAPSPASPGRHAGRPAPLGPPAPYGPAAVAQGYVPMSQRPEPVPDPRLPMPEVAPRAQPRIVVVGARPDDTLLGWPSMPAPTRKMPAVEATVIPEAGVWWPSPRGNGDPYARTA